MAKACCSIGGCYHFVIYFPGKTAAKKPRRLQRLAKNSPTCDIFAKYTICIQLYQEDQTVLSPIQLDGHRKKSRTRRLFFTLIGYSSGEVLRSQNSLRKPPQVASDGYWKIFSASQGDVLTQSKLVEEATAGGFRRIPEDFLSAGQGDVLTQSKLVEEATTGGFRRILEDFLSASQGDVLTQSKLVEEVTAGGFRRIPEDFLSASQGDVLTQSKLVEEATTDGFRRILVDTFIDQYPG